MPLFWTSGDISEFQSQSWKPYSHLAEAYVFHFPPRFTFGLTPADLLVASIAAEPFSSTYLQADIGEV